MRAQATRQLERRMTRPKLGIIAGSGRMPAQLIDACLAESRPFFVLGFEGHTDPDILASYPSRLVRLGAIGEGLKSLKDAEVAEVVMAGRVGRPSLVSLRPDRAASKLIAKLGA